MMNNQNSYYSRPGSVVKLCRLVTIEQITVFQIYMENRFNCVLL